MNTLFPIIFLKGNKDIEKYTSPRTPRSDNKIPDRDRKAHADYLKNTWSEIWSNYDALDNPDGLIWGEKIEFSSQKDFPLATTSLEDVRANIRLLNIFTEKQDTSEVTKATVFIPADKRNHFIKKINKYETEVTNAGLPKNQFLIQTIESLQKASLSSFWRDDPNLIPDKNTSIWCEFWLTTLPDFETAKTAFSTLAEKLQITLSSRVLRFPERIVFLGKVDRNQLELIVQESSNISEIRKQRETAKFFTELPNRDQRDWVDELKNKIKVDNSNISVCVLDSGVTNKHPLLSLVMDDSSCVSVNPLGTTGDNIAHGTLMCGLAAFGDLASKMSDLGDLHLNHVVESSKIIDSNTSNDRNLYGAITQEGVSRISINHPERTRILCMAITSEDSYEKGQPSSWSSSVDQISFGKNDGQKMLVILSAGNINDERKYLYYPESNKCYSIEDPGQAWNALTVGAVTFNNICTDETYTGYKALAQAGELSPFSTTSLMWDKKWPIKPDIVFEGGNILVGPNSEISFPSDFLLLTTGARPLVSLLKEFWATSAASALAANFAARIQAILPAAWPETIRGLIVHSAEWTSQLKNQFKEEKSRNKFSKSDYKNILRACGYGVPDFKKAISCAKNHLTLVSETTITPYEKKEGSSTIVTKDMHIYKLPWPTQVLLEMAEKRVKLRITLSYFIEPAPGEVGWKDRYSYASFGLRFALNRPGESENDFRCRINQVARDESEGLSIPTTDSDRWQIGPQGRNTGSIHSDIWEGTAADIASCNLIGIYPVTGWWKTRSWLNQWNNEARYSLIVSLETDEENIDIYTPVKTAVEVPIVTTSVST